MRSLRLLIRPGPSRQAPERRPFTAGVARNGPRAGVWSRRFAMRTQRAVTFRAGTARAALCGIAAAGVCLPCVVSAQGFGGRLEADCRHDDNVNRSWNGSGDSLSDWNCRLTVGRSGTVNMSTRTRLVFSADIDAEKFRIYDGLDRMGGAATATFQFRPSGAFAAPTLSVFARVGADLYRSDLRDGYRVVVGTWIHQPLTDRVDGVAGFQVDQRHATSPVFEGRDWSGRIHLDYSVFDRHRLYLTGEYRRGDAVSIGAPASAMLALSKSWTRDDVFTDTNRYAYRFDAATVGATLGYNWPFADRQAFDISWRWIRTRPDRTVAYPGWASVEYVVNQITVTYLWRF